MIDTAQAARLRRLSDEELLFLLEDTWINQQLVPKEDRGDLLETYAYLKDELRIRRYLRD